MVVVDPAQVDAEPPGLRHDLTRPPGSGHRDRVEEGLGHDVVAGRTQAGGEPRGARVHAPRDRGEAVRAVVDGVHRRHDREQHLGGADVGGRLVAADVLLARLQGEAVGRAPLGVDRHPDQAARQVSLEPGAHRHVRRVRAAVEQRDAEPLRGADGDVGAERAGRLKQGEGEQVGRDHRERAGLVRSLDEGARSPTEPDAAGYCTSTPLTPPSTSGRPSRRSATTTSMPIASARVRTTAMVCGSASASTTKAPEAPRWARRTSVIASAAAVASSSRDAPRGGQPGEVADHGLEVEQRLEPALGDLRLVRRVGGVPGGGPPARCAG